MNKSFTQKANDEIENENGDINITLVSLNFKIVQSEYQLGCAFININDRKMLITEFIDNEHLSALESFML